MSDFAAWQERMGLEHPPTCAEVIGMTRQQVYRLAAGKATPSPTLVRLMRSLEQLRDLRQRQERR